MTAVYCFSGSGHSMAVAQSLAKKLSAPLYDVCDCTPPIAVETAVVVFPVYAQAAPEPVRRFLRELSAPQIALLATYGRMGFGNVLGETAALVSGQVIAAGCVPTGHSYRAESFPVDTGWMDSFAKKLSQPSAVMIPRRRKSLLARLFPETRSRMGVRLLRNSRCIQCGICNTVCPMGTMDRGRPGRDCLRCLRCVTQCPKGALSYRCHLFLRWYLRSPKTDVIFLVV